MDPSIYGNNILLVFAVCGTLCLSMCATAVFLSTPTPHVRPTTTKESGTGCKALTPWCMGQDRYDEYIRNTKKMPLHDT